MKSSRSIRQQIKPQLNAGIPPWAGILMWLLPTVVVCWVAIKGAAIAKTKQLLGRLLLLPALLWSFVSLSQFVDFYQSYSDALHDFVVTLLMITLLLSAIVPFFISLMIFRDSGKK